MINGSLERGTFHGKLLDVSVVETVTQTYGAALLNPLCHKENISLLTKQPPHFIPKQLAITHLSYSFFINCLM